MESHDRSSSLTECRAVASWYPVVSSGYAHGGRLAQRQDLSGVNSAGALWHVLCTTSTSFANANKVCARCGRLLALTWRTATLWSVPHDDESEVHMARTVVGIFPSRGSAEHTIVELKAAGFDPQRMGIVMRDRSDAREVAKDQGVSSTVGAVTGGVLGGTAGALLAATGALAIPGIGPFITGGVLASLVGGAAGWLVGGLVGLGLSHDEAEYYQNRVEQGGILLTVDPEGRDAEAQRIMFDNGAQDIQSQGGGRVADTSGYDTSETGPTSTTPSHVWSAPSSSADTVTDTRRGMSREMLGGTMPNIPPDASRVPRQDSASDIAVNDAPVSTGRSHALTDDQDAVGSDASRQTAPRRPAMDEDILQGKAHGIVGDKDVDTEHGDLGSAISDMDAKGERDRQMLDEQSGRGTY